MNRLTEKFCIRCGKAKSLGSFYKSPIVDEEHVNMCKACCTSEFARIKKATKDDHATLWCVLMEMGVPVVQENMDYVDQIMANTDPSKKLDMIPLYLRGMVSSGKEYRGIWETDIDLSRYYCAVEHIEEVEFVPQMDINEEVREWGKFKLEDGGYDLEAYEYLNSAFENYTKDFPDMDTNLENRYRDLCKAEWFKRKADESGDVQAIARTQENLKKMLEMLKLTNFQDNKKSETEKFIERLAWTIENTKPAECEDLNKYKDYSGFEPVWEDIMRTVKNLVAGTRQYPDLPAEARN